MGYCSTALPNVTYLYALGPHRLVVASLRHAIPARRMPKRAHSHV